MEGEQLLMATMVIHIVGLRNAYLQLSEIVPSKDLLSKSNSD